MTPEWFRLVAASAVGLLLAALVVNVLTVLLVRSGRSPPWTGSDVPPTSRDGGSADAGTVRCPDCGTPNERGYRYCRTCVAELPGAVRVRRTDTPPLGGVIR